MRNQEQVEALCRLICITDGVDPNRRSVGCGGLIPRDQPYTLWQARQRQAEAILAAGYAVANEANRPNGDFTPQEIYRLFIQTFEISDVGEANEGGRTLLIRTRLSVDSEVEKGAEFAVIIAVPAKA
jgi:hypothetical protein